MSEQSSSKTTMSPEAWLYWYRRETGLPPTRMGAFPGCCLPILRIRFRGRPSPSISCMCDCCCCCCGGCTPPVAQHLFDHQWCCVSLIHDDVSFYKRTACTWTLATPTTTWESLVKFTRELLIAIEKKHSLCFSFYFVLKTKPLLITSMQHLSNTLTSLTVDTQSSHKQPPMMNSVFDSAEVLVRLLWKLMFFWIKVSQIHFI